MIAVYQPFNVSIYSLKDGKELKSIWVSESANNASLQWFDKYVLLNEKLLIDSDKAMPVWTYDLHNATAKAFFAGQLYSLFAGDNGGTFGVYTLPHVPIEDSVNSVSAESLYCIRPGSKFRFTNKINGLAGNDLQTGEQAVKKEMASLGWTEDANGENEIVLSLEQGEMQEAEYFMTDGRFGPIMPSFARPSGPSTKVSEKAWKYAISIIHSGKEVHKLNYFQGLPSGIQLKEGETIIQAVQRLMKPIHIFLPTRNSPNRFLTRSIKMGSANQR